MLLLLFIFFDGYSQRMRVNIRVVGIYSNVNELSNSRISLSLNGSAHIQDINNSKAIFPVVRGWSASDVSSVDPYIYRSIEVNGFTGIDINFFGWVDRCSNGCDGMFTTRYNPTCYCGTFCGDCKGTDNDDAERDDKDTKIDFWKFEPGKKGQTIDIYTNGGKYGIRVQVEWSPANPETIQVNHISFEYCGGDKIVLRAINYPLAKNENYDKLLNYNWYEVKGLNRIFLGTTTVDSIEIIAPSNAALGSSISKRYAVYASAYNVSSLDPTALLNTIQVYTPAPTGINYITNPVSCNGRLDGNVVVNGVTGAAGVYSYILSGGGNVLNSAKNVFPVSLPNDAGNKPIGMIGLSSGTYQLTVSNNYLGTPSCSLKVPVVITQPLPLSVSTIQKSDFNGYNVSCKSSTNGTANVGGLGGNIPYTYLWDDEITFTNSSTNSNGSFVNLKAGNYYTKIVDAKNCPVNPVPTTFTEPTILTATPNKTDVLCNGAANGQININVTGGAGAYTHSINSNPFVSALPFTGLTPGNYTVVTKDKNNCTTTSIPASIVEPSPLILSMSGKQDVLCNGASTGFVILSASGGVTSYQYSYNGVNYQPSGTFNTIPAGTYNLKVKDQNNCITSVPAQFTQPSALQNTFSIENVTCFGREDGSVKANVTGGVSPYVYKWTGRPETSNVISNLYAGNYILSMRDANNCVLQQTATVSAPPSSLTIQSITHSTATCEGICDANIQVNVSGGIAPYTYYYNTIQSASNILTSACGENYTIKIKDNYNCIITDQIHVPLVNSFGVDLPDSITLCTGQSYTVDVTAPSTDVVITSLNGFSSSAKTVQLSETDTYYFYLSNAQGCFKKDTMVLTTSSDLLQSRFIVPSISYAGDTINFVDLSWPRPDSVSWILSVPTDTIGNDEGFIRLSYQDVGTYTIKLTAYMGACRDSVTKTITVQIPPVFRKNYDSLGLGFHAINTINLYPVPNSGSFIVEIGVSYTDEISLDILNLFGERIHSETHSGHLYYKMNYDFISMSPGVYVLWVKSKDDAKVIKFLVE